MDSRNASSTTSIRDVARRANVSLATVSRAFAEPGLVRAETLERVLAVAEELHYRPSRAARSLTTGKTGNIGLVVPDLGNPFFSAILKGGQARAREADYSVFLADSEENSRLELELVRAMAPQVDGVIICSSRLSEAQLQQLHRETTLVLLNRRVHGVSAVLLDSAGGMRQAIEHLASSAARPTRGRIASGGGASGLRRAPDRSTSSSSGRSHPISKADSMPRTWPSRPRLPPWSLSTI